MLWPDTHTIKPATFDLEIRYAANQAESVIRAVIDSTWRHACALVITSSPHTAPGTSTAGMVGCVAESLLPELLVSRWPSLLYSWGKRSPDTTFAVKACGGSSGMKASCSMMASMMCCAGASSTLLLVLLARLALAVSLALAALVVSVLLPDASTPLRGRTDTLTVASAAAALLLLADLPLLLLLLAALLLLFPELRVAPANALLNSSPRLLRAGLEVLLALGQRALLELLMGAAPVLIGVKASLATALGSFTRLRVSGALVATSC